MIDTLPADMTSRQRLEALLPFYVNGTLEGDELLHVRAALDADEELRRQVQSLEAVREQMQGEELSYSPGELGFARLSNAIDGQRRPAAGLWRTGLVAACAALVAVVVTVQVQRPEEALPLYEQASSAVDVPYLQVGFQSGVSMDDITALLSEVEVDIVAGPSAVGLYQLSTHEGVNAAQALAELEEHSDLVDFVELVQ
ncbi:hypothetical protein [Celeribacter sp.]|uniref:hypothetical protein n=1 Tax=Celeribacter sp. TaxID=1890673 RepID=UPI003A8DC981